MECPHCQGNLDSLTCPICEKDTPAFGKFCCYCGSALPEVTENADLENSDDFAERVLCSDGTCIGVINKNGVCNECGKPYTGEPE